MVGHRALGALPRVPAGAAIHLGMLAEAGVRQRLLPETGEPTGAGEELDGKLRARAYPHFERTGGQRCATVVNHDGAGRAFTDEIEATWRSRPEEVPRAHPHHTLERRIEGKGERRAVENVTAVVDDLGRRDDGERGAVRAELVRLRGVVDLDAWAELPEPIGELHGCT